MAKSLQLLVFLTTICAVSAAFPGLGAVKNSISRAIHRAKESKNETSSVSSIDAVTYYYNQTLDHFNYKPESYNTFQQKYVVNSKYWGGANSSAPIFVYTGDEEDISPLANYGGFFLDLASHFNALLVFIEHRYYGESMPFGSLEESYKNASTLGYFSSTQALADYAQLILDLKRNLFAQNSPVIAVGGSYGGMLASWFRLKYPHIAIGAFAISAPILYFDDITPQDGYQLVVSNDFKNYSESCYNTVIQSWDEIDKLAAQPNGLQNLSSIFNTCRPLESAQELKNFLEIIYMVSAQYDNYPVYPLNQLCNAIDGAPEGTSILGRIAAGVNASIAAEPCQNVYDPFVPDREFGWTWQTCTEMVMPIGHGGNDTMFQAGPFDLHNFTKSCKDLYGVSPRPHWITTEFGGHDIKSVLGNFASNIIFSNGLRDPYSAGGVLEDLNESIVAIYTEEGAHCQDFQKPTATDPEWLKAQRHREVQIIALWIAEYNAKLLSTTNTGK